MTHEERIELVTLHILNYVPPTVHNLGVVKEAVADTAKEIVTKWENELEQQYDSFREAENRM